MRWVEGGQFLSAFFIDLVNALCYIRSMRIGLIFTLILFGLSISVSFASPVEIRVGGYVFEPFLQSGKDNKWNGATIDLIRALNHSQNKYKFRFVPTSSQRRYTDMMNGQYDVMFFESKKWGWSKFPVKNSNVFLHGGEVFVTMNSKDQSYFENLNDKRIVAVKGFHYGFANYDADTSNLKKKFNIAFVSDGVAALGMLVKKRGDVAIVSKSLAKQFLSMNPSLKGKLLVSDKMDQSYHHSILVKERSPIALKEVNSLLSRVIKDGKLKQALNKSGIL